MEKDPALSGAYMDVNILRLTLIAYSIHTIEETSVSVPWANKYLSAPSTFAQFVLRNVIFMAYVLISVFPATCYPSE